MSLLTISAPRKVSFPSDEKLQKQHLKHQEDTLGCKAGGDIQVAEVQAVKAQSFLQVVGLNNKSYFLVDEI